MLKFKLTFLLIIETYELIAYDIQHIEKNGTWRQLLFSGSSQTKPTHQSKPIIQRLQIPVFSESM